jgi:hypothetical protein
VQDGIVVIPAAPGWCVEAIDDVPGLGIRAGNEMGHIVAWELLYVDGELVRSQPLVVAAGCSAGADLCGPAPLTDEELGSAVTAFWQADR